jgi:hypothetical protein
LYVSLLRRLGAATQQQNHGISTPRIINAVARPYVEAKLSYASSAWLAVAEMPQLQAVNPPVNGNPRLAVFYSVAPPREYVAAVTGDVVP